MRRHFTPALESQFNGGLELSLEEEQIALTEAAQDEAAINQDLTEAERCIAVSESLEDLAVVADGIEEATPAEAALVEVAGDMAVAGTDVSPEEVVPSMESYVGRRISTEGIRETARQIWDSIMRFLKQVWERIEKFFYKIVGTIPGLRRRIQSLEKRVEACSGKKLEEKKFKVSAGVSAFCVDFKPVKTESELASAFKDVVETAKAVYVDIADGYAKIGEKIADHISDFEPEKAAQQAEDMAKMLLTELPKVGKSDLHGSSTAPVIPGFDVKAGAQLLGNQRVIIKAYKDTTEQGALGALDSLRRSGPELAKSRDKDGTVPSDFEFSTLSLASAETLLKDADKLLDVLEDYKRGKGWKELNKAKDKLKQASDKAEKSFGKLKDSDEAVEKQAVPYFKGMLNFNQAFTRWAQQPAVPFFSHALTSVRAVMVAVEKSTACYK